MIIEWIYDQIDDYILSHGKIKREVQKMIETPNVNKNHFHAIFPDTESEQEWYKLVGYVDGDVKPQKEQ